ncbi:hypothetical protein [Nocardioides zeae]
MNRPTTDDQMLTELFVSVPAPQVPIGDDLRRVRRYRSRRRWARASTVVATVVLAAGVGWLVVPSGGDDAPGPVGRSTEAPTEAPTDHQSVRDALADLLGPDRVGEVPETTVWDNRVDGIDGFVPSWGMELPWAEPGQDGRGNLMVDFFPSATPLTCEDLFAGIGNKPTCDPVTGPLPAGVEEAVVIIEPASDGPAPAASPYDATTGRSCSSASRRTWRSRGTTRSRASPSTRRTSWRSAGTSGCVRPPRSDRPPTP